MTTATVTRRTELAHRTSGGIDVYLFWDEPTGRITVGVIDARTDEGFELDVEGRHALEAFNHPYAYAAEPTEPTIDAWRQDMEARILEALRGLSTAANQADIPETTLRLVELRASQINGCGGCVDIHFRQLRNGGEPDPRIHTVAGWRDVSYFTEDERAALALTEAATGIADRPDPVPADVWEEAARHYDEAQLAPLVLEIAAINAWNRLSVTTRQISGEWIGRWVAESRAAGQAA